MHATLNLFSSLVISASSIIEQDVQRLEKAAVKVRLEGTQTTETGPIHIQQDLTSLRRPWLTRKKYEALSQQYRSKFNSLLDVEKGEVSFRLARHAFLLERPLDAKAWIIQIPFGYEAKVWSAKGQYLLAVIALKANRKEEAQKIFQRLAQGDPSEASAASNMALARLAYDAGNYEDAKKYYSEVQKNSSQVEFSLAESAWNSVRQKRLDIASTNLDLLFALYPESPLLPDAGFLLGSLLQGETDPEEGIRSLEALMNRFSFEEEATTKALKGYEGKEEEILSEFNPKIPIKYTPSILPPTRRSILEKDPTIRNYLAELAELYEDRDELLRLKSQVLASRKALSKSEPITMDGLVLLEWANQVERTILKIGEPPKKETQLDSIRDQLASLHKTSAQDIERLSDIDRHIWISWKALGGERESLALDIKKKTRDEIQRALQNEENIEKSRVTLDEASLEQRKANAYSEMRRLNSLRTAENYHPLLIRLDFIRREILETERGRIPTLERRSSTVLQEIDESQAALKKLEQHVLLNARNDLRRVISESQRELKEVLKKYRWHLAEAKYQSLKVSEKRLRKAQRFASLEDTSFANRFSALESSPSPAIPVARTNLDNERLADARHFFDVAHEYVEATESLISETIQNERRRYQDFHEVQEKKLLSEESSQRERALLAFQQYVSYDDHSPRTPYGLYRLAQLRFELAEDLRKLAPEENKSDLYHQLYASAVLPLRRIQNEFPSFKYRNASLYLLGYALLEDGKDDSAMEAFTQLTKEFPRDPLAPEVHLRIGENLFQRKKYRDAIPHYQQVLTFGFNYFYDKALYKLAWANYLLGRYESAISHFLILLDYKEELPEEQRGQFLEFNDEATEYVAFSLYRSGGAEAASRIFSKTGWKPYAFSVTKRIGEIARDRGDRNAAISAYSLAATQYPLSSDLPKILKNKLELREELRQDQRLTDEMSAALETLGAESKWRQANLDQVEALRTADQLLQKITYKLASRHDLLASREGGSHLKTARQLFSDVTEHYPESVEAYESHYRLGEIAFSKKEYAEAVENYDVVVRSGNFNSHFSDSLYGIVASREELLKESKEAESAVALADDLIRSIENFALRAPDDPRVPQALYRSAQLSERTQNHLQAQKTYLRLAAKYPQSPWSQQALVAPVEELISRNKWKEASDLAGELTQSKGTKLLPETKSKLLALREKASFKQAEMLESTDPAQSQSVYIQYQKEFPSSDLAPKAVFNTFALAKRNQQYRNAEEALDLLLAQYPKSPESHEALLEKAFLQDALLQVEDALSSYFKVLEDGSHSKSTSILLTNISILLRTKEATDQNQKKLLAVAARAEEPLKSSLLLEAANYLEEQDKTQQASGILEALSERPKAPSLIRVISSARLARFYWLKGEATPARKWERLSLTFLKSLKKDDQLQGQLEYALVASARVSFDRSELEKIKINSKSEQELVRSFKRKASLLGEFERAVLRDLKLPSAQAQSSMLYDLGGAYYEFASELRKLPPPEKGKEEFDKSIQSLSDPLIQKSKQALFKSLEIITRERMRAPFLENLLALNKALGTETLSSYSKEIPQDVDRKLPSKNQTPLNQVLALLADGKDDKALKMAREFLENQSRSAEAYEALGLVLSKTRSYSLARLALERAYQLDPESASIPMELALGIQSSRESMRKLALLKKSAEKGQAEAIANWANEAYLAGLRTTACEEWKKAASAGIENHPALRKNIALCEGKERT